VEFLFKASGGGHLLGDNLVIKREGSMVGAESSSSSSAGASETRGPLTLAKSVFRVAASLFIDRKWRLTVPVMVVWFAFGFSYYGLVFLSTRIFSTDTSAPDDATLRFDYADIAVSSCSEVIAVYLVARSVNSIGRQKSQLYLYIASGIGVLLMCLSATGSLTLTLFFSILGRISIMGASCVTWLYTPEIYSAERRATAHSICFAAARIGAILCPFVVEGDTELITVGTLMFVVDLSAAAMLFVLPESYKDGAGAGAVTDSSSGGSHGRARTSSSESFSGAVGGYDMSDVQALEVEMVERDDGLDEVSL
jgi:hypothetical protein